MTWLAPWALLGLTAIAAPVIVHWLARHHAQRIRFPTIEFLMRSSPVSVRRHRLRDKRLLAVRIAIIAVAALALAQPVWVRPGAPAAQPARAIVLDTSASLGRTLADGRVGTDVARDTASAAAPTVTIATERVSEGVAKAAAWLARQAPPRELVVVSDFQVGALVESDFDSVPDDAQVRLLPIAVTGPVPTPQAPARGTLRVLVGREQVARAAAAEAAARALVKTSELGGRFEIALVFPSAANEPDIRSKSQPIDTPELFAWVTDIQDQWRKLGGASEKTSGVFFADKDTRRLLVFPDEDPGSEQAAALMAAILRAAAPPGLPDAEREPDTIAPATLATWQRDGTARSSPAPAGDRSDGRWLWLLVLVLFGVETWMRRRPVGASGEAVQAHAA
jgi:hypothetical protein